MMVIKMEQGFDRFRAASFAYSSTAFSMLTGTLVTVVQFDWDEPSKVIRLQAISMRRACWASARRSSRSSSTSPFPASPSRNSASADELIDVVLRRSPAERVQLSFLRDLAIPSRNGKAVPITLPLGYRIEIGGAIEDSARGQKSIAAGVPLPVLCVPTLLMIQLESFSRMAMVLLTAPLGLSA